MRREYKFRGMDLKGNWYYGNLAVLKVKNGICEPGPYISNSVGMPFAYDVRPETVGQYTGLKDRNGKEIYENCEINNKYIVSYDENKAKYILTNISNGAILDIEEVIKNENAIEITNEYRTI